MSSDYVVTNTKARSCKTVKMSEFGIWRLLSFLSEIVAYHQLYIGHNQPPKYNLLCLIRGPCVVLCLIRGLCVVKVAVLCLIPGLCVVTVYMCGVKVTQNRYLFEAWVQLFVLSRVVQIIWNDLNYSQIEFIWLDLSYQIISN